MVVCFMFWPILSYDYICIITESKQIEWYTSVHLIEPAHKMFHSTHTVSSFINDKEKKKTQKPSEKQDNKAIECVQFKTMSEYASEFAT